MSRQTLAARRRRNRRRGIIAFSVLLVLLLAGLAYGSWQPAVRVSHVTIYGADQSFADFATAAMQGSYLGIIPRNSVFFVPEARIRSLIMSAHPDIAAVSIFRSGMTGLSVKVDYRVPIARWCGAAPAGSLASTTPLGAAPCHVFDANGFVYATTSTDAPVNPFILYEPPVSVGDPIGSTLPHAAQFPTTSDFARQLMSFGSSVVAVVIRDDEVDQYLSSGTRVTYVLGDEQNAFTALASARTNFNLANGSVEYVDLRFPGKVYLKKK